MTHSPSASCSRCVYSFEENAQLFCRRYPPNSVMSVEKSNLGIPRMQQIVFFPVVTGKMSCGEFQTKISEIS